VYVLGEWPFADATPTPETVSAAAPTETASNFITLRILVLLTSKSIPRPMPTGR
jgi:hypothetical protein